MSKEATRATVAIISAAAGLIIVLWLFSLFVPRTSAEADWTTMAKLAVSVALAFGVAALVRFALAPLLAGEPPPPAAAVDADVALRSRMAPIVLGIGSAAIILLALGLIVEFGILDVQPGDNTQNVVRPKIDTLLTGVFASVLPVFATWVGTVIAFYFTNESFRQAAQVARESAAGLTERLRGVAVKTAMVPRARMIVLRLPDGGTLDSILLKDINDKFKDARGANGDRISRLVILGSTDNFVALIHRSVWMELINNALQKTPPTDITTGTLGPLIDQPVALIASGGAYRDVIRKAVAFVGADQTLADAKASMDAVAGCQDVMVTQTGAATMPVLGWIMNTDIGRLSQA